MSEHEPLPDDIETLLSHERSRGGPSPEQRARLASRLFSLGTPALAPTDTPPVSTHAAGSLSAARLLQFISVFALGLGAGAGLHALIAEPVIVVETVQVPSPEPVEARPPEPLQDAPVIAPAEPLADAVEATPVAREAPSEAREQDDAARDLALIERARVALARGQSAEALQVLGEHRRRFPRRSDEEREALTVQALAADGQRAEAGVRARAFLDRYPRSLFRSVVAPMSRDVSPEARSGTTIP